MSTETFVIPIEEVFRPTRFADPLDERLDQIAALRTTQERATAYNALVNEIVCRSRERFVRIAAEVGFRPADLHAAYGVDYSFAGLFFSGVKSVSVGILSSVCCDQLHISCHELIFGEPSRVVLPTQLAAVIDRLETLTPAARAELLRQATAVFGPRIAWRPSCDPISPEFVYSRVDEIADELGVTLQTAARLHDWGPALSSRSPRYERGAPVVMPAVKRLITYSLIWQQPVDYFLARDYTRHSHLFRSRGSELVPVTAPAYVALVSLFLRLDPEDQAELIATLLLGQASA